MYYSNKMFRKLFSRIRILMFLPLVFLLFSCSLDKKANWTILVYMAADNSLGQQAVEDIIQMERAKYPSSVNVIVQLDPDQYGSDPQGRRYKIAHNTLPYIASPVIEYLGEIDSGYYLTLADFVNWGVAKYPANHYLLVIWSHGSGWTREDDPSRWICPDTNSLSQMSIAGGDFKNAFQLFSRKMDIMIMDACFMQTIEVITEVYQYNDFIIASENSVPYEGFPYQEILELWNHYRTPQYIAAAIVDRYMKSHLPGGSQNPGGFTRSTTCSAVKTSRLPHFLQLLQQFVVNWQHLADSEVTIEARRMSQTFNFSQADIDLKEFFSHLHTLTEDPLLKSDLEVILAAIDELFIAQASMNLPFNTGTASIWYPDNKDNFLGSRELYNNLDFAQTGWLNFLESSLSR